MAPWLVEITKLPTEAPVEMWFRYILPFSALEESKVHGIFKLAVQDLGLPLIWYS
jgi:hypothetical protein